jgi:hypothetical protein
MSYSCCNKEIHTRPCRRKITEGLKQNKRIFFQTERKLKEKSMEKENEQCPKCLMT